MSLVKREISPATDWSSGHDGAAAIRIRAGFRITLDFREATPAVLMLYLHPSTAERQEEPGGLRVDPPTPVSEYLDLYGNRCGRLLAPAGRVTFSDEIIVADNGEPDPQAWDAAQHRVEDLPDEVLLYLLASRYCEVDSEIKDLAGSLFGSIQPGWPRVAAICGFVHRHLHFDYLQARPNRTSLEALRVGTGVCRDFTHLAITLCRCMNIPARYCTGYLGDIGIAPTPPMDFSAWFEAYLGGAWHVFDARNNVPRIGRVLMARGRDAADVALTTTFGLSRLDEFSVWADEIPSE
jgi:transglutaminase-like putative cysteine protease